MLKKSESVPGLLEYDLEKLIHAVDVLRASGKLESFTEFCRSRNLKILVDPAFTQRARAHLKTELKRMKDEEPERLAALGRGPEEIYACCGRG